MPSVLLTMLKNMRERVLKVHRYAQGIAGIAAAAVLTGLIQAAPAVAAPAPPPPSPDSSQSPEPAARVQEPGKKLGKDWKTSADRAVTTAGCRRTRKSAQVSTDKSAQPDVRLWARQQ
jgi:hypothetical protein